MKDSQMIDQTASKKIKDYICDITGLMLVNERLIDFEIILKNRLLKTNKTLSNYLDYLVNNYNETIILASFFTIQETSFYRNKSHFDRLKYQFFPELVRDKTIAHSKIIQIISAGCSTGEEPYTVAMILNDLIPDKEEWCIKIIGTDINLGALEFAKKAAYTSYKLRNINQAYIDKYFISPKGNEVKYLLNDTITRMVEFRQCNLIREPFELSDLHDVDLILCENVIIYFNQDSIKRLIGNFYNTLREGGYLFLGYSETLNLIEHNFDVTWWQESFAYRKLEKKDNNTAPRESAPFIMDKRKEEIIPNELRNLKDKSYEEILYLLIQNCDEKNLDNSIFLFEVLETNNIVTDEVFYIIKAEYLLDKKLYIDAANSCRKSISINPYFIDAHIMLGAIYLELDMLESADFELRTSLYIDKKSVLASYLFALYNKKTGNDKGFRQYLLQAYDYFKENNYTFKTRLYPLKKEKRDEITENIMQAKTFTP